MSRIRLLPEARRELRSAAKWYEAREGGVGQDFLAEVHRTLRLIAENPTRFRLWRENRPYRRHRVRRFPYVVFYEVRACEIRVFAVAHMRLPPGYWLDRAD